MSKKLSKDIIAIFIVIGVLDFFANKLYLYWTTWWVDIILHFLSGAVVAMVIILFLNRFKINLFWTTLLSCLLIGVLWEVFELYIQSTYLSDGIAYWTDTSSDVFLDVLGGYTGIKYSFYILNKYGK
jgi:putative effector of murein hydrolase